VICWRILHSLALLPVTCRRVELKKFICPYRRFVCNLCRERLIRDGEARRACVCETSLIMQLRRRIVELRMKHWCLDGEDRCRDVAFYSTHLQIEVVASSGRAAITFRDDRNSNSRLRNAPRLYFCFEH
jgi:hypothetical protein